MILTRLLIGLTAIAVPSFVAAEVGMNWVDAVQKVGLPAAVVLGVLGFFARACWYVLVSLFDRKDGAIPVAIRDVKATIAQYIADHNAREERQLGMTEQIRDLVSHCPTRVAQAAITEPREPPHA
jgi:hypothetical protein